MKKFVIIDANALVHRAFHALPASLTAKGISTNAIYGFFSVLIKTIKDLRPDYMAAAFDLAGPTFRHEEFAEYKSHRIKAPDELYRQIPYIKDILKALGVPIYEKPGFEADDLIGSAAENLKKDRNLKIYIMTGDLDTLQLVDGDRVVVSTLKKGITDAVIYGEKKVMKRYGLKPSQIIDFKGLKGDPSDNIPGVAGVGEKTASTLIKQFGSLENLYKEIEKKEAGKSKKKSSISSKLKEKLLAEKETAFFSKKLATIIKNMDFSFKISEAEWQKKFNKSKFEELLKDLSLYSLIKRFNEVNGQEVKSDTNPLTLFNGGNDFAEISKAVEFISDLNTGEIALEIGQGGFLIGSRKENVYIKNGDIKNKSISKALKKVLEDEKIEKICHDAKNIYKKFRRDGIKVRGFVFDIKLAHFLIHSDSKDFDLDKIYFNEFKKDLTDSPGARIEALFELKERLTGKIKELNLGKVLNEIELPLSSVLAEMELAGVKVDKNILAELSSSISKEIKKLEGKIYSETGREFNINSPQQLSQVLFNPPPGGLGLRGKIRKTGKGVPSTAASELDKLSGEHPIVDLVLRYRELQKLKNTYIDPFPEYINPETQRIHTTFNQIGAATGRLSSQDPNLQNIPIRSELGQEFRKAFIAEPGRKLLSFDYSQFELRIVAHISNDEKMIDVFKKGEDIHTRTAAEIFEVDPEDVTANMRRDAKVLNFGIIYGMGAVGVQRASGVTRETAREFMARYMEEFSGIAGYIDKIKKEAYENGYVTTIFGRRRELPEIYSSMPQLISQAERMAINMPIQGSQADIIKMAMVSIQRFIEENRKEREVAMLLQIHDELLFETDENISKKDIRQMKEIMEGVHKLKVPVIVDVKIGDNWSEMEALF